MGFLHLGWESATYEDEGAAKPLADLSPLWGTVAQSVDLSRPGLPTVQRVLGWHPLHVAAMAGSIELIRRLVEQFRCDLKVKSMNSWTPLHYAAAYNQVGGDGWLAGWVHGWAGGWWAGVLAATSPLAAAWEGAAKVPLCHSCTGPERLHLTPVHVPLIATQVAAIETLISLGCEVVVQDAVGSTPLHVAAGEGHLEAIEALVRLGCSSQGAASAVGWGTVAESCGMQLLPSSCYQQAAAGQALTLGAWTPIATHPFAQ